MLDKVDAVNAQFGVRYVPYRKGVIVLHRNKQGFWQDEYGTIWALQNGEASVDVIDRCGIGILSLPADHPLTRVCRPHDFMYSSPVFQYFYTRREADKWLYRHTKLFGFPTVAEIFYNVSKWFGGKYWENWGTK